jgi:hypothetical protein
MLLAFSFGVVILRLAVWCASEVHSLLGTVVHTCNSSTQEAGAGGPQVQGQPGCIVTLGLKNPRAGCWAPLALACNPSYLEDRDGEDCCPRLN